MSYENIVVETKGRVGIIRLNRPQALNALNRALVTELFQAIDRYEADDAIGCMLLTGRVRIAIHRRAELRRLLRRLLRQPHSHSPSGRLQPRPPSQLRPLRQRPQK